MEGMLRAKTHKFAVQRGTSHLEFFKFSTISPFKEIWSEMMKDNQNNIGRGIQLRKLVLQEGYVVLQNSLILELRGVGNDDRFQILPQRYFKVRHGLGLAKNSAITTVFNHQ